ncbi:MAG TPA: twin-arginine translocation signal domain-containing protein, partial [Myxococcota bacterium]
MPPFTRRGFLTRAALAGGALVLPSGGLLMSSGCGPNLARRTPHYFVFYFLMGGWDLVLTTDPVKRNGDKIWIPYEDDEVVEIGPH